MHIEKMSSKIRALPFILFGLFIIAPLSLATCERNALWKDDFTLWTDIVHKSKGKARAYYNLGAAYHDEKGLLDEAITYYRTALTIEPDYASVHNDLGDALRDKGLLEPAIIEYKTALRLKPAYPKAHNNLGIVYCRQGKFDEAIRELKMALRLNPEYAEARNNLEDIYNMKGLK
ncbi:MAG: tetratricopeptide repeat protein [Deltaproteobacteria bacterium]|nr:tetratricopeptide repeat protein [Deltaproteobacteria bacterium]